MLKKAIFLTLLLTSVTAALGQKAILVHLPPAGQYVLFSSHGLPSQIPSAPIESKGGDASVAAASTDDQVSVWNKATNNIGSKPIDKIGAGWTVAESDLDHVATVDVKVQHNGNPVAAAQVDLEDGTKREPVIVDPASAGVATFFDVKPGRLIATVRVKGSQPITQIFQLAIGRPDVKPTLTVAVADAVDAGAAATAPATTSSASAPAATTPGTKPSETPSAGGTAITYLLALVVAAGVGFAIFSYFKKYDGTVAEKLEQLGVQIPKPNDIGAAGGAPMPIDPQPKPAPPQKILLDDAAPTPLSTPIYTPIQSSVALAEPSLLSSAGIAIPLSDGETVVGRDAGLGLSLTGEASISRRHASLVRHGSDVVVSDLGSTNGTFINGARIQAPATLRPGDNVQFGSVQFRFQG